MITLLGPTACGKTTLAAHLAGRIGGEIISADSRQVYRRMDIGTGKDLADYTVEGRPVPYHLIDIAEPGERYNLYRYQQDFLRAYTDITARGRQPILSGGTGLYIEAIIKGYQLPATPSRSHPNGPREPDESHGEPAANRPTIIIPPISGPVIGLAIPRELRRERITGRLKTRLDEGMVAEVQALLDSGVPAERLIRYGLEYRFVTEYLLGQTTYDEMVRLLEIAIHQFAKRQMTWFRGMETRGTHIQWIDATLPMEEKIRQIIDIKK